MADAEAGLDLEGKVVVVTGGNRGIGEQLVRQSAAAGATVLATYHSNEAEATALSTELGGGVSYQRFALGDQDATRDFLTLLKGARPHYFIANAGAEFSGSLAKHAPDNIARVVTANVLGNAYLLQGLITQEVMQPGGQIAVIGSIAADGNHDQFAYSMSKAALRGGVESLARYDSEVRAQGLGVKLIEPAFVRTPMAERALSILERRAIRRKGGDELVAQWQASGYVMDADHAAAEILGMTANPDITGTHTIPEGTDLHAVRTQYIDS